MSHDVLVLFCIVGLHVYQHYRVMPKYI